MTTITIDRAAFEAHMDATAPAYWRTTEHGRDAWRIWQAALQSQQAAASEPLGFQVRRAIKAEDELRALKAQIEGSNLK